MRPWRYRRALAGAAVIVLCAGAARAQMAPSVVSGRVLDPSGQPVASAHVALLDALGAPVHEATTDAEGVFRLAAVMPGAYALVASTPALRSPRHRVAVADGLPSTLTLTVSPRLEETVAVADTRTPGATAETALAGEAVRRTPAALASRALRLAVSGTPGWTSEDNGLLHYRGSDDGMLFVIDGVPVYERLDPQFGAAVDPLLLGSVRVLSGYVPPEYGLRAGGVIEVRSQREEGGSWSGLAETGGGADRTVGASGVLQGPVGSAASLTAALGGERTDRFLDPVSLDNRHNHGSTAWGSAELLWTPGANVTALRAGRGVSSFEVPLRPGQSGDPRQRVTETFATANWHRAWSGRTVSQAALFTRRSSARLFGSSSDVPLLADADRSHRRLGLLAATAHERGAHRLKAGLEWSGIRLDERFLFAVTDVEGAEAAGLSEAARAHDRAHPFAFSGHVTRPVVSAYVQDSWRATGRLTVEAGLRYDRSRLLVAERQWSPRAGAAYRFGRARLRLSANRFFQPPQTEFLLLSSSPQAHALSPFRDELGRGGADVRAERQTAVEAGCELTLGRGLRADVAVWRRWMRNQGDPNLFFGTTIIFPNSVARGVARGLDARVELPRYRGVAAFVTYTLAQVEQFGPIDGGLFLEDDITEIGPGTRFVPDHDQRHAVTAQVAYDGVGGWATVAARYRTGTPLEVPEEELDEISAREGADLVDLEAGRVRPHLVLDVEAGRRLLSRQGFELSARVAALNVTGARYAFNFANPFSGTHFGAPRTARLDLRLALR